MKKKITKCPRKVWIVFENGLVAAVFAKKKHAEEMAKTMRCTYCGISGIYWSIESITLETKGRTP